MTSVGSLNSAVWNRLTAIIQKEKIGSAYCFIGPEGSGKEAAALAFAAAMNCESKENVPCGTCAPCIRIGSLQDEKLKLVFPLPGSEKKESITADPLKGLNKSEEAYLHEAIESKAKDPFVRLRVPRARKIMISQVRDLRRTAYLKSELSGRKCIILFQAHTLAMGDGTSANALLKILEEPPPNTTIILVTDYSSQLPLTILSRCQQITFPPMNDETAVSILTEKGIEPRTAKFCVQLSDGNIHKAVMLAKQPSDEWLSHVKEFVQTMLKEDAGAWKSISEEFSRMARFSPEEYRMRIAMAQKWFHEAYLSRSGADGGEGTEVFVNDIAVFNRNFPNADLKGIYHSLDAAALAPEKNLYMPLVITNMILDVRTCLPGTD